MKHKNSWEIYEDKNLKEIDKCAHRYMDFLDKGKTERECVKEIIKQAEENGYKNFEAFLESGKSVKTGDTIYATFMNKAVVIMKIGKEPMTKGINILGAHIDSPRLDIKQNPLYEDSGIAYLDTHYYGGIKKYQWVTIPLALHGVVVKKDGTVIEINVGEKEDDPVFFVSDLLAHLADEQLQKKAGKVVEGEALDLIIGNKPVIFKDEEEKEDNAKKSKEEKDKEADEKSNPVKTGVLRILKEKYGFDEEDFLSAELEVVPAGRSREAGFDRSLILGYGQDDRVCAFTAMDAMFEIGEVDRTACCILVDKEEIGSMGATGMHSKFFENTIAEIMNLCGEYTELNLRRCLANSCMLSSDVNSAYDPHFADAYEKNNTSFLGEGIVISKFTGAGGKYDSNDANAEYMAHLRDIFEKENVNFQTAELGKVDLGGGGTIAFILAQYGMNVIDSGVAVLNMHAPWECTSKVDVYENRKSYVAFLKRAGMNK